MKLNKSVFAETRCRMFLYFYVPVWNVCIIETKESFQCSFDIII